VISTGEREIGSRQIGEYVMEQLREMDEIAYVRFASVYRSFQDVNQFREEIERLQKEPSEASKRQQLSLLPEK
jgi:transcriptional repressor NrdR